MLDVQRLATVVSCGAARRAVVSLVAASIVFGCREEFKVFCTVLFRRALFACRASRRGGHGGCITLHVRTRRLIPPVIPTMSFMLRQAPKVVSALSTGGGSGLQ